MGDLVSDRDGLANGDRRTFRAAAEDLASETRIDARESKATRSRGSLSRRLVFSDGFRGYGWGRVFQSGNADCAGVDYDDARHPALVALVATVGIRPTRRRVGVIAAGMRLRLSAYQYPRAIKRPRDSMASEMEAARKASACQPRTAFTMPLPIGIGGRNRVLDVVNGHRRLAALCRAAQGERNGQIVARETP